MAGVPSGLDNCQYGCRRADLERSPLGEKMRQLLTCNSGSNYYGSQVRARESTLG